MGYIDTWDPKQPFLLMDGNGETTHVLCVMIWFIIPIETTIFIGMFQVPGRYTPEIQHGTWKSWFPKGLSFSRGLIFRFHVKFRGCRYFSCPTRENKSPHLGCLYIHHGARGAEQFLGGHRRGFPFCGGNAWRMIPVNGCFLVPLIRWDWYQVAYFITQLAMLTISGI